MTDTSSPTLQERVRDLVRDRRNFPEHYDESTTDDIEAMLNKFDALTLRAETAERNYNHECNAHDLTKARAESAERKVLAAASEERESFRPLLTELYGDMVYNAYNAGIERPDGKWMDGGISDAEWLCSELGVADVPQPIEAMRAALPSLIERKVNEAIAARSKAQP